jgi:hypothetical protein
MYQCLALAGMPVKILFEDQLAELGRYALVVIPELFSAPGGLVRTLEKYVRGGGLLFMSLQTPNCPQTDGETGLWRIFSAAYQGQTPPLRSLRSHDAALFGVDPPEPLLAMPVYDWPVVQHQLFGGFPNVSHQRARLQPTAGAQVLLFGYDSAGKEYPLMIEAELDAGTAILSTESFGATFNSYMQKCAGHPSMWLGRALTMRNFVQQVIWRRVGGRMPALVEARGNVATFWWKGENGRVAWLINHEYSDAQTVRLSFADHKGSVSTQVLFSPEVKEYRDRGNRVVEVVVDPASMAAVIVKAVDS